jgi:type I restriction enzyme S subunit
VSFPRYESYRDGGVKWLGEVPNHWQTRRLKTLVQIKKRIAGFEGPDVLSITQQGIRVRDLESNDGQLAENYAHYQLVEIGDFAMNQMDLLTGWIDIAEQQGVTSPDYRVFSVLPECGVLPRYLLHLLQSCYSRRIFYAFGQGASHLGRWRLPTEAFQNFVVPLPPMGEQRVITEFLDRETAKIGALVEEQRRLIELLKEKRQAVISHAVTKGLDPSVPMKEFGVEWLGKVPAHWTVTRLKHVVHQNGTGIQIGPFGAMLKELAEEPTGYKLYGQQNIISGDFDLGNRWLSEDTFASQLAYHVRSGDLLVTRKGSLGNCRIIPPNIVTGWFDSDSIRVRVNPTRAHNKFIQLLLHEAAYIEKQIEATRRGAILSGINSEVLANLLIVLPPTDVQEQLMSAIDRKTATFDRLVTETVRAIALLEERRTALISAAVTGKIDVRGPIAAQGDAKAA